MSSEAREFEFNKTWFVEGDFPTLKFMVAYYLGSRDFFLVGVFINIAFYGRELKYQVSDDT